MANKEQRLEDDVVRIWTKVKAQELDEQTTERLGAKTGRESLESTLVEIPELVNNWVRKGDISLLVGFGGVGKSTIAMNLGVALASGSNFIWGRMDLMDTKVR
jgi:RecA-family ATPase